MNKVVRDCCSVVFQFFHCPRIVLCVGYLWRYFLPAKEKSEISKQHQMQHRFSSAADADVDAAECQVKLLFPRSLMKMTDAAMHRHGSAASLVLAVVSLALITILSVWKLNQFQYKLIHETGGAMFYGKWP